MVASGAEQNRHEKGNNGAEADPPRKFHDRQPFRLGIELTPEYFGQMVGKSAQNRDHDKAGKHGNEIAVIVPARFRQHAGEKNSENGAVSVTINPEHNRNNAHSRPDDDKVRGGRGNDDHQNRKPDCSPIDRAQTIYTVVTWLNVSDEPIADNTR